MPILIFNQSSDELRHDQLYSCHSVGITPQNHCLLQGILILKS